MKSAFGVEHISKADEYRPSLLAGANPRSETKVKRGTAGKRYLKAYGGATVGQIAGTAAAVAAKRPQAAKYTGLAGAGAGYSLGRSSNLKSGDVVATNRRTGQKAKNFYGVFPYGGYSY